MLQNDIAEGKTTPVNEILLIQFEERTNSRMSPEIVKGLFGLGGTIIGAVIGALFKGWYDLKNRDRREIVAMVGNPAPLILMSEKMVSRVQFTIDGKPVPSVASCEIDITNTGNRAVENIKMSVAVSDGNIILLELHTPYKRSINTKDVEINQDAAEVKVSFINCNEVVSLRVLLTSNKCNIMPNFDRQKDVVFSVRQTSQLSLDNPVSAGIFRVIRSHWFLHVYFILVFPPYRRYVEVEDQAKIKN